MEYYQIWLIAAIVLVIIELLTAGFGVICFAVGALFSALAAFLGVDSLVWQLLIFAVASVLCFIFLRPVVLRLLDKKSKDVKTNADALIGKTAMVSETIDSSANQGRVAVDGDDWKAVSADGSVINKGEKVEIISRDSIILTVKK
ncbi:MAG: NfeD family protein [Bacteroidales bacterium]|nr:NfeD family protein [Bacteroidales bacterium]